ncbi:MAG: DUF1592 domain-containing protein, partial [Planctomycetota bacterium]
FREEPVNLRGISVLMPELHQKFADWYLPRLGAEVPDAFEELRVEAYLLACWKHRHENTPLPQLAESDDLDRVFLENWWEFLTQPSSNPYLNAIRDPWDGLPGPDEEATVVEKIASIADWLERSMPEWRSDEGADRESPEGRFFLTVSDVGDGNRGDYVAWKELAVVTQPEGSDKRVRSPLFPWIEERLEQLAKSDRPREEWAEEAEKLRAVLDLRGRHPEGIEIPEWGDFVVQAPHQIEIWLPAEVSGLRGKAMLAPDSPDSEWASFQGAIRSATTTPKIPVLISGVRPRFAEESEVDNKFSRASKKKSKVFPTSRVRRMEDASHHMRRSSKPEGIYFLTHEELAARLPKEEQAIPKQFDDDYRLLYLAGRGDLDGDEAEKWDRLLQNHLAEFAERAFRRPLTEEQRSSLDEFYKTTLEVVGNREEAARETAVRILVSTPFLYKIEPPQGGDEETKLDAWALASRLSYSLWSTAPDSALREAAESGALLDSEGLREQVTRMLAHPNSATLAEEFAGQWLDFRSFEDEVQLDPELFPDFDENLKQSMQEEATRFFTELIARDLPVTDILHGDYTYLDERLAEHYGIESFSHDPDGLGLTRWEVERPRGGILGMGAILAATSFPDRTSPVRRGDWILTTLLGYELPPVPADVPELENDGLVGKLPLRERLEKHREAKSCRGCHDRIDPPGFALENLDAIGRWREKDGDGRVIDASATLVNGRTLDGSEGLRAYLADQQADFLRQFCTKLLGYALGREVIITDRPLLETMEADLAANEFRFSAAVNAIVQSRQFQNRRNL